MPQQNNAAEEKKNVEKNVSKYLEYLKRKKESEQECNTLSNSIFDFILPYKKLAKKLCSFLDISDTAPVYA